MQSPTGLVMMMMKGYRDSVFMRKLRYLIIVRRSRALSLRGAPTRFLPGLRAGPSDMRCWERTGTLVCCSIAWRENPVSQSV
jgi:hypothetical protein